MEKELLKKDDTLNSDGTIKNIGWARSNVLNYNKEAIKKKSKVKEWDYYLIEDNSYALCLAIANLGYMAVLSASVVDFKEMQHYDKISYILGNKNKDFMSLSSTKGICDFSTKKAHFVFDVKNGKRHLSGTFSDFYKTYEGKEDLEFDIVISDEPKESIFKSTPFKKKHQFCLSHNISGMACSGKFTFKGKTHNFSETNTTATLNWVRAVLPYNMNRYWASMNAKLNGENSIGFNLGKSFGDNTLATENVIFANGVANKISDVKIYIRRNNKLKDYMSEWTFYSSDGRLELIFEPLIDRHKSYNYLVFAFMPHLVFGSFSGKLVLDDGRKVQIENMSGFAERIVSRW